MRKLIALLCVILVSGTLVGNAETNVSVNDTWFLTGEEYTWQRNEVDTGVSYYLGNIQLVLLIYPDGVHCLGYFAQSVPEETQSVLITLCNELNSLPMEGKFFVSNSYLCYSVWEPQMELGSLSFDAGLVVWPLHDNSEYFEKAILMGDI